LTGAFPVDKIVEILCTVGQIYEEIDDVIIYLREFLTFLKR